MALLAKVVAAISAHQSADLALADPKFDVELREAIEFENGTGLGQANIMWTAVRTLAASASETLDLAGVLADAFGATLAAARIKCVLVVADKGNTNNVNITRDATSGVPLFLAAGDGIPVQPGGLFLWVSPTAAGVVVTAGTGDLIGAANSAGGTPVTYKIIVIGASS